ncbi:hypothetical protein E4P40_24000 [Blastococcus sp. CT_GayMR20]|uniref:hypothetical protein n=1 Tax=Blastococcus sp. CT_GayMR20 TaxID=2559609 RepID=UPI0010730DC7|nr:hypothetical protein [Blastococcus sp. CT_GayMR20]TFV67719.1 hypothetical protein E4P40_24000 [Blastococcus sp. CT_GayMR20]
MSFKLAPTTMITVFCLGQTTGPDGLETSHASKKSIVARYSRLTDSPEVGWAEKVGTSSRTRRRGQPRTIPVPGGKTLTMAPTPDKPEAYQSVTEHGERQEFMPLFGRSAPAAHGRDRYRLKCELCPDTVPVRRENLVPVLDTLATAGVEEISLAGLAARLR